TCSYVGTCSGGCAGGRRLINALGAPGPYCPVVRGGSRQLKVQMARSRELSKLESACTPLGVGRLAGRVSFLRRALTLRLRFREPLARGQCRRLRLFRTPVLLAPCCWSHAPGRVPPRHSRGQRHKEPRLPSRPPRRLWTAPLRSPPAFRGTARPWSKLHRQKKAACSSQARRPLVRPSARPRPRSRSPRRSGSWCPHPPRPPP